MAAGVYLATARLLVPTAASPETDTTPAAVSPVTGSAFSITPAGRFIVMSIPATMFGVPAVLNTICPFLGIGRTSRVAPVVLLALLLNVVMAPLIITVESAD